MFVKIVESIRSRLSGSARLVVFDGLSVQLALLINPPQSIVWHLLRQQENSFPFCWHAWLDIDMDCLWCLIKVKPRRAV